MMKGTPETVIPTLLASLSESSIKQYDQCLKKWWNYCLEENCNPYEYNLNTILEYFSKIQNSGLSFSSLNTQRAALSLIFSPSQKDENILKRFFKGAFNLNPPQPKYAATWNPNIVLNYLEQMFPLENLSLEFLSCKLVTLLALTSAHRMQTLSKICLGNIKELNNVLEIRIPDRIKTSGYKKLQPLMIFPIFPDKPSLCVAKTLSYYIKKTSTLRPRGENKLFITWKKPHHSATSQTLSRWVKRILQKSGIDISQFSTHSTRHASTSAALRAGVNIEVIRNAAGWSQRSNVFVKFYNRPVTACPDEFARSIITQSS